MTQFTSKMRVKSHWREKQRFGVSFLCPLCKTSRVVPHKSTPGLRHFVQVLVTSAFLTALTWGWFEWKGIVVFAPLWVGFEVAYRMRARVMLACPHCGFDPYLQLADAQRARQEIEAHWRTKFAEKGIPFPEKNDKGLNAGSRRMEARSSGAAQGVAKAAASSSLEENSSSSNRSSEESESPFVTQ